MARYAHEVIGSTLPNVLTWELLVLLMHFILRLFIEFLLWWVTVMHAIDRLLFEVVLLLETGWVLLQWRLATDWALHEMVDRLLLSLGERLDSLGPLYLLGGVFEEGLGRMSPLGLDLKDLV